MRFAHQRLVKYVLFVVVITQVQFVGASEGTIHLRIESIEWKESGYDGYFGENYTYFELEATIEIWNELSDSYTFEHSDSCKFKAHTQYIGIFSSFRGFNYYPLACDEAITPVVYQPGITKDIMVGGVTFDRTNLTTLPLGIYMIKTDLVEWNSGDVGYNLGVNITVDEEGTRINFDNQPSGWGSFSSSGSLEIPLQFPVILLALSLYFYKMKR
ncbi:MAG: hypothetical protein ACXAD7_04620 [Candidatus Kariarchaeaceae archaeon]|jgi:hypothetical protein